nr:hypothetical protein [uncultured bacterium]
MTNILSMYHGSWSFYFGPGCSVKFGMTSVFYCWHQCCYMSCRNSKHGVIIIL